MHQSREAPVADAAAPLPRGGSCLLQRPAQVRTECQLLVPFVLTGNPLVARVGKRLAQMMQTQAQLKIIKPAFDLPTIRQSAVNSFGVTYAKLTYWPPTRSRAWPFLMENNPYLNSTETFSTRGSTEPLAD